MSVSSQLHAPQGSFSGLAQNNALSDPSLQHSYGVARNGSLNGHSSGADGSATLHPDKRSPVMKRKRGGSPDTGAAEAPPAHKSREPPKKKKANRACFHCQKAHLTCDDSRPCQRCVKRGIGDNCTEGHRKKAKYLLDEDELEALKAKKKAEASGTESAQDAQVQVTPTDSYPATDPLFNLTFDPSYTFTSEAANLEYSILSAILGNPAHDGTDGSQAGPSTPRPPSTFSPSNLTLDPSWSPDAQGLPLSMLNAVPQQGTPTINGLRSGSVDGIFPLPPSNMDLQAFTDVQQPPSSATSSTFSSSFANSTKSPDSSMSYLRTSVGPSLAPPSPPPSNISGDSPNVVQGQPELSGSGSTPANSQPGAARSTAVYRTTTKAYDYTEGYHFLMKHLHDRFDKNDILRIVRALAIFRPSLIALQMPLSEEDEIFVEKCFQRSLLELEKLISFSGTPTVVWRRTGEICVVGLEFTMLTDWTRQDLLGSRKYIYELFENQSTVEYWEKFATHAFENSTQSVYSHCVLLKPSGAPVPCSFCFSIRRDIFDLPNIVIGQWLPLL